MEPVRTDPTPARHPSRVVALGLALLTALVGSPVAAQVAPTAPPLVVESSAEALARDAGEYARLFGVDVVEAQRRLVALDASVAVTDRIADDYRDRLAGISIEHRPNLRIVVSLTGDEPVPDERVVAGGFTLSIVFHTGAKATRDRVIWAMTYHQAAIRAVLARNPAMGLDPRTGELVVVIGSTGGQPREALRAKVQAIAGVPVRLRVLDQVDVNLSGPAQSPVPAAGGARLEGVSPSDGKRYLCTAGYAVTDGQRYGIATAAHCVDDETYVAPDHTATPLSFVGQWGWGYQDVQVNASPAPLAALFFADTAKTIARPVTAARNRESTRAGDFVCHRGERTGYSCATVELTDFAPAGDLCGGPCLPTWVTVAGPGCKGGDSGAPVFVGTTALGIVKGATYRDTACAFYFYMSVDYLPKGWRLVMDAPPLALPPPITAKPTP